MLQFLDWRTFYTRSLAVDGVIPAVDGVIPAVDGVIPAVDGVVPAVDGVVPAVDGVVPAVDGVVPAVDGVVPEVDGVVPVADLVDLMRVLVTVAVDMVWAADMVIMVLQATEVMEVQVALVNTRIMMDKELGPEVITLLGMEPLSLMEESPRLFSLRSFFGGEVMNL